MKPGNGQKVLVYFLSASFLLMMNGLPRMAAGATERGIAIGEMISKGEVKFEARENVWRSVEPSHFPVIQGIRMKTENGEALISLFEDSQIKVAPESIFHFDENTRLVLSRGKIDFRLPRSSEITFKIGELFILKSRPFQAARDHASVPAKNEEALGSISLHSSGSVTIRSIRGKLSILDQDHAVLAALSSNDSITLPSTAVGAKPPVRVAQVGEISAAGAGSGFAGISTWAWAGVFTGVGVVGAITYGVTHVDRTDFRPVCP